MFAIDEEFMMLNMIYDEIWEKSNNARVLFYSVGSKKIYIFHISYKHKQNNNIFDDVLFLASWQEYKHIPSIYIPFMRRFELFSFLLSP